MLQAGQVKSSQMLLPVIQEMLGARHREKQYHEARGGMLLSQRVVRVSVVRMQSVSGAGVALLIDRGYFFFSLTLPAPWAVLSLLSPSRSDFFNAMGATCMAKRYRLHILSVQLARLQWAGLWRFLCL